MMSNPKLGLEILNGPLDGLIVKLDDETVWGKQDDGPLVFPWDTELGTPQARFFLEEGNWWLEVHAAPHGTYCVTRGERIEGRIQLEKEDVLKASEIWLLVSEIE